MPEISIVRLSQRFRMLCVLPALLFGVALLSSCAALIASPVSDADRVTTHEFDGHWSMTTVPLSARQTVGKERFNCTFEKRTYILNVKDGVARVVARSPDNRTNVASNGRFRLEIPTDRTFQNSTGNNDPKNRLTEIYQGILSDEESTGLFILGKESLNNAGCSARMTIRKMS